MKAIFFVPLLFAAVVAQPDSDSDSLLYRVGGYPYTTPYAGYAGYTPYTAYSGLAGYTGYPYRYLFKRDAETDSDSDSLLYMARAGYPYTTPYAGYAGYAGYTPYTAYSGLTGYTGYPYRYLFKRDAETDSKADSYFYNAAYPYNYGYNPYTPYAVSAYARYPFAYGRYLY